MSPTVLLTPDWCLVRVTKCLLLAGLTVSERSNAATIERLKTGHCR